MRRLRQGESDDEDEIPLHHKQAFGAGLKRKKVEFVRAQDTSDSTVEAIRERDSAKGALAGDLYASIVLGNRGTKEEASDDAKTQDQAKTETKAETPDPVVCAVCSLPITTSVREHEASLAHQVSVTHSHPPSALDRSRMGLRALTAQGWDPDARIGLGREGEGMRFPIKVAPKEDTLGIGAVMGPARDPKEAPPPPKQLSARERKAREVREREKDQKLRGEIFGSVDVERYLRGDGSDA
ncbi:hypothetical protein B0I35DRAFT_436991 [Stachybotrys elegans]|uniref:G-patch domain-containing protein n=1 Tax=Stachybotrys elegans TaxID=80388 RepID=A0A8K0SMJ0_9HYPO|nr:hypothetical protein B0I35DRAFT_436991 [Stachybotrys elegans]